MVYANNVLPKEAAYYELNKATIVSGTMSLQAGGSAKYTFTTQILPALTDFFRISIAPVTPVDKYHPTLLIYLHAITKDNKEYYYTLTPTSDEGKIYTHEIELEAAEYKECTFTVYATEPISLTLWELCPEAADSNIEVEIDGVKQSLPRLLYDYNTEPLSVGLDERVIGLITFNLKGDTDLQGHLEVSYTASEDCVATIRVKDTGTEELYTPIIYDIKAGRGNIALPHSYLHRLNGYHTTYVTAQVSSGSMTIGTRGLLYTIDGGYLAERVFDAGVEVLDFSVEQPEGSLEPTKLWVIGIDTNECFVRSRDYYADNSESFIAMYSLGYAKAAALEFNGKWVLDTDEEATKYTIITDEEPYAFWTDIDDNLYCQKGQDETTRFLVDENVSMVSACRGFSSTIYPEQDQGLVVLYVKNGIVTYRNYCRTETGTYTWQGPFTIDLGEELAISAYVHRLNDYRLSFTISTATNNYWYITTRTYVTQAAPVEQLVSDYSAVYPVVSVLPVNTTYDNLVITASMGSSNDTIIIEFSYPIYAVDEVLPEDFVIQNDEYYVTHVELTDSKHITLTINDKNYMGLTVNYIVRALNLRYLPLEGIHVPVGPFTIVCPGYNYKETLRANYSSVDAHVSQRVIETITGEYKDNLSVSYNGSNAEVTLLPIITKKHSIQAENFTVSYTSTSASTEITQTGVSPI